MAQNEETNFPVPGLLGWEVKSLPSVLSADTTSLHPLYWNALGWNLDVKLVIETIRHIIEYRSSTFRLPILVRQCSKTNVQTVILTNVMYLVQYT